MKPSRATSNKASTLRRDRPETKSEICFDDVELALCNRWQDSHDIFAARCLVGRYKNVVVRTALNYRFCRLPADDLVGEGHVGLMRAICRFDPSSGMCFAIYAEWWVREAIQAYVLERQLGRNFLHYADAYCRADQPVTRLNEGSAAFRTVADLMRATAEPEQQPHVGARCSRSAVQEESIQAVPETHVDRGRGGHCLGNVLPYMAAN